MRYKVDIRMKRGSPLLSVFSSLSVPDCGTPGKTDEEAKRRARAKARETEKETGGQCAKWALLRVTAIEGDFELVHYEEYE